MPEKEIPIRLEAAPIVDAIFDIHFHSEMDASTILPGLLHGKWGGGLTIERLPAAELVAQMGLQPDFKHTPLLKITRGSFFFFFGPGMASVACALPYPGWEKFRKEIIDIVDTVISSNIATRIERWSLRYLDLIPGETAEKLRSDITLKLEIPGIDVGKSPIHLQMEVQSRGRHHKLFFAGPTSVIIIGKGAATGLNVGIHTITPNLAVLPADFGKKLPAELDGVHEENKRMFFSCLSESGLASLKPIYK